MRANSLGGITAPVGLLGRIGDDHFGFRGHDLFDFRGAQHEGIVFTRFGEDRDAAGIFHHVRIADPVGRADDDFVAGIDERADGVEDGVLAADVDYTFGRRVGRFELRFVPVANGLAQRQDAGDGSVFCFIVVERFDDGALDVFRRGEIRLAGTEVRDVDALSLQFFRFLQDGHGRRDVDAIDGVGELDRFR